MLAYTVREAGEPSLLMFYGLVFSAGIPVFVLYLRVIQLDVQIPFSRVFLWAIVFRIAGLLGGPFYEDDYFRYLWDGFIFWETGSPYGVAPEAFFTDSSVPVVMQATLNQINHPEISTIYGPATQAFFLLGHLIAPGNVLALQVLLIAVDLLTMILLSQLTHARNIMLYAWCPLVIKEIAFTAHPDGLAICLAIAAVLFMQKRSSSLAAACLGFAVGFKVIALLIVPFMLLRCRLIHWIVFATTLGLLYLPFIATGTAEIDALLIFARAWEFNSALYALLSTVIPSMTTKVLLGALFGLFWFWLLFQHHKKKLDIPRGDWIFGGFLLVAPVINPWYALWLLPYAAIYPSRWAWTASIALMLAYVTGLNLADYTMQAYAQPWFVRLLEFSLIAVAWAWDFRRRGFELQSTKLAPHVPADENRSGDSRS